MRHDPINAFSGGWSHELIHTKSIPTGRASLNRKWQGFQTSGYLSPRVTHFPWIMLLSWLEQIVLRNELCTKAGNITFKKIFLNRDWVETVWRQTKLQKREREKWLGRAHPGQCLLLHLDPSCGLALCPPERTFHSTDFSPEKYATF